MFKRFALPLAFVLVTSFAQADKKALVDEIIKLSEADKQIEESFAQITKNVPNPFKGKFGDQQTKFDEVFTKAVKEELIRITKEIYGKVMPQLAGLYDKHFTEEDLAAITAFMKSPAGIKQKNMMPKVMEEMSKVMQDTSKGLMPAMQDALKKGMDAAKKAGIDPKLVDELLEKREEEAKKQKEMMEKFQKMQEEGAKKGEKEAVEEID